MSFIKNFVRKIVYGYRCDSNTYIKYLRNKGASIGSDVNLFSINSCHIDVLNAHLLEIGNHVNIVASTILTHDYAWAVIKGKTGEILGNQKPVTIGNNVFIGHGSIILGGGIIEDNVIIGAKSVVSGKCEHDSVYAGNPAKKIMTLDEYMIKRKRNQFQEAKNFVELWLKSHGEIPDKTKLHEYFYLFERYPNILPEQFKDKLKLGCNYEQSFTFMEEHTSMFASYEEFIEACLGKERE